MPMILTHLRHHGQLFIFLFRFNARHRLRGHLFAGRYKSLLVDDSDGLYFRTVCDYVHLNPARARILRPKQPLDTYPWSSVPLYLSPPSKRPAWLDTTRLLGELNLGQDTARTRRAFARLLEERRSCGGDALAMEQIRSGWHFGGDDFLERLAQKLEQENWRDSTDASPQGEMMEAKARRMIAEFLRARRWDAKRLKTERKLHPVKIELASLLRKNTTQSMEWIAAELFAGARTTLANELSKLKKVNIRD